MSADLERYIDQLMLGEITGRDLPHPLIGVYLLGLFEGERSLEEALAQLRRRDASDAAPPARNVRCLEGPTFAEISRVRGDRLQTLAALRRTRANREFGRGVA